MAVPRHAKKALLVPTCFVICCSPLRGTTCGAMAEWLRSGLQIRVHEFDSRSRLQEFQRLSWKQLSLFQLFGNAGVGQSAVWLACTGLSLYVDRVTKVLVDTTLSKQ